MINGKYYYQLIHTEGAYIDFIENCFDWDKYKFKDKIREYPLVIQYNGDDVDIVINRIFTKDEFIEFLQQSINMLQKPYKPEYDEDYVKQCLSNKSGWSEIENPTQWIRDFRDGKDVFGSDK